MGRSAWIFIKVPFKPGAWFKLLLPSTPEFSFLEISGRAAALVGPLKQMQAWVRRAARAEPLQHGAGEWMSVCLGHEGALPLAWLGGFLPRADCFT